MPFNNFWQSIFDVPYIPPCERNPYYDDPRDFNGDFSTWRAAINEQENTKTLTKCVKCGTYFIPISFDRLCEDCRNNSQET